MTEEIEELAWHLRVVARFLPVMESLLQVIHSFSQVAIDVFKKWR